MAENSKQYQEFQHVDREYCRRSGPLNPRKGSFPPATLLSGLGLVTAAIAVVAAVLVLLPLILHSTSHKIGIYDASIRVEVENRPVNTPLLYVLSSADSPDSTLITGTLENGVQYLSFTGLEPDTDYIVSYYRDAIDPSNFLGNQPFHTKPANSTENTPGNVTRPTVEPTEPPTEPTEPPTEPTEPPTEPTEPPTEPTEPPTEPTEPPTEPTEPPTEPTEPPTEPTEPPTEPTEPPTEPTEPPTEPTEPPTEPTEPPVPSVPVEPSDIAFLNIRPDGSGYLYTVEAKFTALEDITPVSMEFFRQRYSWYWDEEEPEERITVLTELSVDSTGAVIGLCPLTDPETAIPREQCGDRWRVVLVYIDSRGQQRTAELTNHIEPLSTHFNNLSGTVWQEDGMFYIDYVFHTFIPPHMQPGDVILDSIHALNWTVDTVNYSRDRDLITLTGRMHSAILSDADLNAYFLWTVLDTSEKIYSGCGMGWIYPSQAELLTDDDGTTTSQHRFAHAASDIAYAKQVQIVVTLSDGSKITLDAGQTDPSGVVTVDWAADNDILVTVRENGETGTQCTVELIVHVLWEDSGDRNITVVGTTRSTLTYP